MVTQSNAIGLKICGALRQLEVRARSWVAAGAGGRIARLQYAAARCLYADALEDHQRALQLLRDYQLRLLQDQVKLSKYRTQHNKSFKTLQDDCIPVRKKKVFILKSLLKVFVLYRYMTLLCNVFYL